MSVDLGDAVLDPVDRGVEADAEEVLVVWGVKVGAEPDPVPVGLTVVSAPVWTIPVAFTSSSMLPSW